MTSGTMEHEIATDVPCVSHDLEELDFVNLDFIKSEFAVKLIVLGSFYSKDEFKY